MTQFAAVLTGDIIASRALPKGALENAMGALSGATASMHAAARFERTRGDGWQIFLPDGAGALRAALHGTARLACMSTPVQTRIGIGLGRANVSATAPLAAGHGPAFEAAGDLLDTMHRDETMLMDPAAGADFALTTRFLAHLSRGWTSAQAAALYDALALQQPTQAEIAARHGVTRQAIQDRLSGTGLRLLRDALRHFESTIASRWSAP